MMAQVFYRKRFSSYLGEQRAIDDIITSFVPDGPAPSPTPSATPVTPTPTPTPSITPTITLTPTTTTTATPTITPTITPTSTSLACDFTYSVYPTPTPSPTNTSTPTLTPTPTITPSPSPGPAFDPDAQAFFNAIVSSGGTLTSPQETAINNLVLDLKGYGLWNKFIGLYPVVGSGATVQLFNLKNPSQHNLDFEGTWAHTISGASPSSNGYAATGIKPNVYYTASTTLHYSMYITENFGNGAYDMGAFKNGRDFGFISSFFNNNTVYCGTGTGWFTTSNGGDTKKNWLVTNDGTTTYIYRDGSLLSSGAKAIDSIGNDVEIVISANNNNGSITDFGLRDWALASIGYGMDGTEAANFNTAVVTYQTALGRQN